MPPSDRILPKELLDKPEKKFPLDLGFCPECSLVQIMETVPPEFLFGDEYLYFSSFSPALLEHSRKNAFDLIEKKGLTSESLVVELASNDGYLLKNFVEKGIPVLGIDPAPNQAAAAEEKGVPTLNTFFSKAVAEKLKSEGKQADIIIGNNVLAHVADTHDFVEGISILLKEDGMTSIEVPYLKNLVEHQEFDTIYLEHCCYFSLIALDKLFKRHNLFLNDFKWVSIHGGTVRLYVQKFENPSELMTKTLQEEKELGMDTLDYYGNFAKEVEKVRDDLVTLVKDLRADGKKVVAYGAAAKGTTMLNFTGLDHNSIDYVVDRNTHKFGKFMPGVHVEIKPTETLLEEMPDYVLMLPWNFKDEILEQQKEYREKGGKFIIPIPHVHIV